MKKVVKVDEMIVVARNEAERANRYLRDGKYDLYKDAIKRVEGMVSIIAITSIKVTDNWDEEWLKIYNRVNG